MDKITKETYSMEETYEYAKEFAKKINPGTVATLIGDLGVGKTVFAQGFAKGLGIKDVITSPTFNIVMIYEEGRLPFYHFDVYRIGDSEEMYEVGYEEYVNGDGVCLIEWANLIEDILPDNYIEISIDKDIEKGFDYRRITLEAKGENTCS